MTVVVGYIPNRFGEAALRAGIEEARRRGTDLVVVNATKGDALVDQRHLGDDGLAALHEQLADVGVPAQVDRLMGEDVAEQLLATVREHDAEVLVIGIRHRTAVGKLIMGSVAQRVLTDAPCWVIAVKPGDSP